MKTKLALLSLLSCLACATVAWAHGQGPAHDGRTAESATPAGEEDVLASAGDLVESGGEIPALEPKAQSETDESDEDTMGSAE